VYAAIAVARRPAHQAASRRANSSSDSAISDEQIRGFGWRQWIDATAS
jgi:hypothetical protein